VSSLAAAAAAGSLTRDTNASIPEPTHGMRATVGAGLTFFSDILHVGLARPVDRPAPLRFVAGFGAAF
jgi:hypothetical protein